MGEYEHNLSKQLPINKSVIHWGQHNVTTIVDISIETFLLNTIYKHDYIAIHLK